MSSKFDGDLLEGQLAEDAFARILLAQRELWEHKKDRQCVSTGNVALEFEASTLPDGHGERRPSGLAVCEGYWFVIEYDEEPRLVVPAVQAKHLARAAIRTGRHRWIGDGNRFHSALVPVEWFVGRRPPSSRTRRPLSSSGRRKVRRWSGWRAAIAGGSWWSSCAR